MIKPYPIGRQDFKAIIEDGYAYVDKTERMYEMIKNRTFVFLSRPRRFGKSLLINTLQQYFEGNRELFKDLKISRLEKDWIKYPVFRFDMSSYKDLPVESMSYAISNAISKYEKEYSIKSSDKLGNGERFKNVIEAAYKQTGRKAVVLIDEYDSPLLAHLHDGKLADVKPVLQELYQQVKVNEQFEQFVFITGISRFSQVSIFSTLNNLVNISMDPRFDDICGISSDELLENFKDGISQLAERYDCTFDEMYQKLKNKYDGYHFSYDSKDIFNPLSVLSSLDFKELKNFWFETATSSYVIDHLKKHNAQILDFEGVQMFESGFYASYEDVISVYPLLYQAGYLTIKDYDRESEVYTLSYPNSEVRVSMLEVLMPSWVGCSTDDGKINMQKFYFALKAGRIDDAFELLKEFFLQIPNVLNNKNEKHFQTVIYVLFRWLGFYTQSEVNTSKGRLDCILFAPKQIFIIEFKVDESAEKALAQINEKGYADPYHTDGRPIIKIGVNFSSEERTIEGWKVEEELKVKN
ncbi:MAG: ATP-binding protein [Paludibacteraceae bacterium]|nr:ATP-binding protein [Paludibacteraceae bacterium]